MGVSLSIKHVPEALARQLRARAQRNHRSLQRELMAIVESAAATAEGWPAGQAAIRSAEPQSGYATRPEGSGVPAALHAEGPEVDGLLAELDAIVDGSRWGSAPLLSREQLHDRSLARELDFDCREAELRQARAAAPPRPG